MFELVYYLPWDLSCSQVKTWGLPDLFTEGKAKQLMLGISVLGSTALYFLGSTSTHISEFIYTSYIWVIIYRLLNAQILCSLVSFDKYIHLCKEDLIQNIVLSLKIFILSFGCSTCSMWDLSSLSRDWTCVPCSGSLVLTRGPPGKSLVCF